MIKSSNFSNKSEDMDGVAGPLLVRVETTVIKSVPDSAVNLRRMVKSVVRTQAHTH